MKFKFKQIIKILKKVFNRTFSLIKINKIYNK